jgi:hypothetical protein
MNLKRLLVDVVPFLLLLASVGGTVWYFQPNRTEDVPRVLIDEVPIASESLEANEWIDFGLMGAGTQKTQSLWLTPKQDERGNNG